MGSLATLQSFGAFTPAAAAAIQGSINQSGLGTTGNVFYLDPVNGNDSNNGQSVVTAVRTLAAGYALLVSGHNDVLVLVGNGASSGSARITAGFTWAKDAAHLIGVCAPSALSQRARIANTTTGAAFANFFTVSGNGCLFRNISWFQGFASGVAAEICLTVSGQRNAFINCDIEGMGDTTGATDAGSRNLKLTGGENYFGHCNIGLDTITRTGANSSIEFASGTARNIFEDCTFPFLSGDGATLGVIASAAAASDRFQLFKRCAFINAIKSTATAITGLCTLAASMGGLLMFMDCLAVGVTAWGTDATSKGQIYTYGPANNTGNSIGANPA